MFRSEETATALPALAADDIATQDEIQSMFDIAFGVTFTSNYISRGTTQTTDRPGYQGYVEASYGMVYAGVWASNVWFGGVQDAEIDVYAGIRPEFGNLSLDIGYARYIYTLDPTVYGEIYAKASYAFTDTFSAGTDNYYDPHNKTNWSNINAEFSGLPMDVALSGSVGTDFNTLGNGMAKYAWDIGVSKSFWDDKMTLDLRYYDSNMDPARIVGSVSFDFGLADLGGN